MPHAEHDPSELVRLAKLVKLMRDGQRKYFNGDRSPATLAAVKDYERRVDKAVKWVILHRQPKQGTLFNDPPKAAGKGPYGGKN